MSTVHQFCFRPSPDIWSPWRYLSWHCPFDPRRHQFSLSRCSRIYIWFYLPNIEWNEMKKRDKSNRRTDWRRGLLKDKENEASRDMQIPLRRHQEAVLERFLHSTTTPPPPPVLLASTQFVDVEQRQRHQEAVLERFLHSTNRYRWAWKWIVGFQKFEGRKQGRS